MTNSSPPSRTTVSVAPTQATIRRAIGFEQLVAGIVPQAVVDVFEIVEIDEGDRRPAVVALGEQDRLGQSVVQQGAVGKPGQRVMGRHELDAVFGELAFDGDAGDLGGDIDETRLRRSRLAHGRGIKREGAENLRPDAT